MIFPPLPDFPLGQVLKNARDKSSSLEPHIPELIRLRTAIIHQCQLCIDTHVETLRRMRQGEARIQDVFSWQDSALYTLRERAALTITDALAPETSVRPPENLIRKIARALTEAEVVEVALIIFEACDADSRAVASWPSETIMRDRFRLVK